MSGTHGQLHNDGAPAPGDGAPAATPPSPAFSPAHSGNALDALGLTISDSLPKWAAVINEQRSTAGLDPDPRLKQMAEQFDATTKALIAFFRDDLDVDTEIQRQKLQLRALDAVEREMAIISLPLIQRLAASAKDEGPYAGRLAEADRWAGYFYSAYAPKAIKENPAANKASVSPIVYFDTAPAMRRFFLTDYPLITLRFRSFAQAMEWCALAHEMGHFVFYDLDEVAQQAEILTLLRDRITGTLLNRRRDLLRETGELGAYERFRTFDEVVESWAAWIEEVFADVCGALFAGPAYADSTRELVDLRAGDDRNMLAADDGEHPPLYLRPFIALRVLEYLANHLAPLSETAQLAFVRKFVKARREAWERELIEPLQTIESDGVSMPDLYVQLLYRSAPFVVDCLLTLDSSAKQVDNAGSVAYTANIKNSLISSITHQAMLALIDPDHSLAERVTLRPQPSASPIQVDHGDVLPEKFGRVLDELRRNRGLTGEQLAQTLLRLLRSDIHLQIEGVDRDGVTGIFTRNDEIGGWATDGRTDQTTGRQIFRFARHRDLVRYVRS
jgi:hypothetical protein